MLPEFRYSHVYMEITTKQAYYQALAEMETYIAKGFNNLTENEEARLSQLTDAVEAWEEVEYPLPLKPDIIGIIMQLMEERALKQTQVAKELNISSGFLSAILSGKKDVNLEVLKNLHAKFHIDGNVLLDSL